MSTQGQNPRSTKRLWHSVLMAMMNVRRMWVFMRDRNVLVTVAVRFGITA